MFITVSINVMLNEKKTVYTPGKLILDVQYNYVMDAI